MMMRKSWKVLRNKIFNYYNICFIESVKRKKNFTMTVSPTIAVELLELHRLKFSFHQTNLDILSCEILNSPRFCTLLHGTMINKINIYGREQIVSAIRISPVESTRVKGNYVSKRAEHSINEIHCDYVLNTCRGVRRSLSNNLRYCVLYLSPRCWGWLIEELVDEFIIEKYIEISIGIQILAISVLRYNSIW